MVSSVYKVRWQIDQTSGRRFSRMVTLVVSMKRNKKNQRYSFGETSPSPSSESSDQAQIIDFSKEDDENPRNWPRRRKFINVAIIAFMAGEWRVTCSIAHGAKAYE